MQNDKAQQLQRSWGDKPCEHKSVEKEYFLGAQTGDYVCTTCGKNFFSRQEALNDAERNQEGNP